MLFSRFLSPSWPKSEENRRWLTFYKTVSNGLSRPWVKVALF